MGAGAAKATTSSRAGTGQSTALVRRNIDLESSWFGHDHLPLFPDHKYTEFELMQKHPCVYIKLEKKNSYKGYEGSNRVQIELKSKNEQTAELLVFLKGETTPIETFDIVDESTPGSESLEINDSSLTRREFRFGENNVQTYNFIIYMKQNKPLEAKYELKIANKSVIYEMEVILGRKVNVNKWYTPGELSLKTTVNGTWTGFASYGGAPTDMINDAWLLYNHIYVVNIKQDTKCMIEVLPLEKEDIPDKGYANDTFSIDNAVGIIVLKALPEEPANRDITKVDRRVLAHSVFPISETNQSTILHAMMTPGIYHILIVPRSRPQKGYVFTFYMLIKRQYRFDIKSDIEIRGERIIAPLTTTTPSLTSVWYNQPYPDNLANPEIEFPYFDLTIEEDSFVAISIGLTREQMDNPNKIEIEGKIVLTKDGQHVNSTDFSIKRTAKKVVDRAEAGAYATKGTYRITPKVLSISDTRDAIFTISAQVLQKVPCKFVAGPYNPQFVFRLLPKPRKEPYQPKPYYKFIDPWRYHFNFSTWPGNITIIAKPKWKPFKPDPYFKFIAPHQYKFDKARFRCDVGFIIFIDFPPVLQWVQFHRLPFTVPTNPCNYSMNQIYSFDDIDIDFYVPGVPPPTPWIGQKLAEPNFYVTSPTLPGKRDPPEREFTLDIERNITNSEDLIIVQTMAEEVQACRKSVEEINNKSLAELIAYKQPPDAVYKTIRAVLAILGHGQQRHWEKEIRKILKDDFLKNVQQYDPTTEQEEKKFNVAREEVKGLDYETCLKKGSLPTALLFTFVQVVLRVRVMAELIRSKAKDKVNKKMKVLVNVIKGTNLAIRDTEPQSSDPFVKIRFNTKREKTAIVFQNLNPIWNEKYTFNVKDPAKEVIYFEVYDHDPFSTDDEMGKAEVALCDLKKEQENIFDLPLTDVESGILTVSLTPEFFGK